MSAMQLLPLPSVRAEQESFVKSGGNVSRPAEKQSSFQSMLDRVGKQSARGTERNHNNACVNDGDKPETGKEAVERKSVREDETDAAVGGAGVFASVVTGATAQDLIEDGEVLSDRIVGTSEEQHGTTLELHLTAAVDEAQIGSTDRALADEVIGEPQVELASELKAARTVTTSAPADKLDAILSPPWADDLAPAASRSSLQRHVAMEHPHTLAGIAMSELVADDSQGAAREAGVDAADLIEALRDRVDGAQAQAATVAADADGGEGADSVGQGALLISEAQLEPSSAPEGNSGEVPLAAPVAGQRAGNANTAHGDGRGGEDGHRSRAAEVAEGSTLTTVSTTADSAAAQGFGLPSSSAVDGGGDVAAGGGVDRSSVMDQLAEPLQELIESIARERGPGQTDQVSIRLKPEFLGEVLLRVSVDAAGTVNARFVVDNPVVRAMIEQDIGQLQASLDEHGLVLGEASVDAGFSSWADGDAGELGEGLPSYTGLPGGDAAADGQADGAPMGLEPNGIVAYGDGTMTVDIRA